MKYLFSIIFIFYCNICFYQNATSIEYEIRWKQSNYVGRSRFIFNDSFSYHYFIKGQDTLQFETVFSKLLQHHSTFCDKKLNLLYNGVSVSAKNNYLLKEKINKLDWTLYPDTKMILGYTCFKAVTKINSHKITVWYCNDLGDGIGLPFYAGLPGTILQIDDKNRKQTFIAVNIVKGNYQFSLPLANIISDAE